MSKNSPSINASSNPNKHSNKPIKEPSIHELQSNQQCKNKLSKDLMLALENQTNPIIKRDINTGKNRNRHFELNILQEWESKRVDMEEIMTPEYKIWRTAMINALEKEPDNIVQVPKDLILILNEFE